MYLYIYIYIHIYILYHYIISYHIISNHIPPVFEVYLGYILEHPVYIEREREKEI